MTNNPKRPLRQLRSTLATVPAEIATPFAAPHGTKRTVVGRHLTQRRERFRALYPLCCICAADGLVVPFDYIDHIHALEDGGPDTDANCWGICHDHHTRKTTEENERRAARGDCSKPLAWLPPRPPELDRGPTIA